MKFFYKKLKGVSLAEMVIAIGVFGLVISSISIFSVEALRSNKNTSARVVAHLRTQELLRAISLKKTESWRSITELSNTGPKHLVFANNQYTFANGSETTNGITSFITVENVYRNASNAIVTDTSQRFDPSTKRIKVTISWTDPGGVARNIISEAIVSDWNVVKWTPSSQNDFDLGTKDFVVTSNTNDGEIKMENIAYPDWCKPRFSTTARDLPGSGIANTISAVEGRAFIGTGSATPSSTNPSFINVGISNQKPPVATVNGQFNNVKVNSVSGEGNFSILATDNDNEEVQILDLTTASPYTRVGWFNAPGTSNATSVFILGNRGYVTTVDNKLYIFDITSKIGSRTQLGVFILMGEGSEVQVVGDYAYISLTTSTHIELQVVNVANPAAMFTVGVGNTSQSDASDLFVNPDGTRAYVGTASSTEGEFIVFNTAAKPAAQSQEYFQEVSGQVVMEAERFQSNIPRSGKSWTVETTTPTGASGNSHVLVGSDTGVAIRAGYSNTSPELGYKVNFTTIGTYNYWMRVYMPNINSNEIHGGYDGADFPSLQGLAVTSYNSWQWVQGSITIKTPEMHWINVWMAEDGARLDKIVLTRATTTPSGTGPIETSLTTGSLVAPEINRQIAQYETNGMSVEGVTVVQDNTRAILVGTDANGSTAPDAEEYQVINLDTEATPARCGGIHINSGINAISSIKEADEDSYSYIITKETASEFRIIRGGAGVIPGSGGAYDEEYNTTGTYTSPEYDTGTTYTRYISMNWEATVPPVTSLRLQLRTGNTSAELNANPWFGPDGTSATFFTDAQNSLIPETSAGKQFIQYRIYFTSDGTQTPTFNSITINYEN